jgi:hypothetical protein
MRVTHEVGILLELGPADAPALSLVGHRFDRGEPELFTVPVVAETDQLAKGDDPKAVERSEDGVGVRGVGETSSSTSEVASTYVSAVRVLGPIPRSRRRNTARHSCSCSGRSVYQSAE